MKITAENRDCGGISILARPRTLKGAARKIEEECEFWQRIGWEGIMLEGVTEVDLHNAFLDGRLTLQERKLLSAMLVR